VLANGKVGPVRVTLPLDPCGGLDDEAIAAARQWRFSPGMKDGQPVPVRVTLILSFRLH
jgi:TonB family protein